MERKARRLLAEGARLVAQALALWADEDDRVFGKDDGTDGDPAPPQDDDATGLEQQRSQTAARRLLKRRGLL